MAFTVAPSASSSASVAGSEPRFAMREERKGTVLLTSPFSSYVGAGGRSITYSARWMRMSIARVTAEVMMEDKLVWASWVYCCGGGRMVES